MMNSIQFPYVVIVALFLIMSVFSGIWFTYGYRQYQNDACREQHGHMVYDNVSDRLVCVKD